MTEKFYPGHPFIEQIVSAAARHDHIVIDGFAGVGGTTSGFDRLKNYYVIACINHWDKAINTHNLNHPNCLHIEEDFRTADLSLIIYMVNKIRLINPNIQVHLWLSLECTNFSNAKGGMPRDADSRTLADHSDRYVIAINPDVIWIENVKEFLLWGSMIPKVTGKSCPIIYSKKKHIFTPWLIPDPNKKGEDFDRWVSYIETFGYDEDHKVLNVANYGIPQHRIRLFMQFVRKGKSHYWPQPTHSKMGTGGLPKWNPIKNCLDLEDEGTELLGFIVNKKTGKRRPRIKSVKTIDRLIKGCDRHVINGEDRFITKSYSGNPNSKNISINQPSGAITGTGGNAGLLKVNMVDYYFGNGYVKPINSPGGVSGTKDGASIHSVTIIDQTFGKSNPVPINNTSPSITGIPKANPITYKFISQQNEGSNRNFETEKPADTATSTGGKMNPVTVKRMVMDTQFNNEAHSLEQAAKTVTANRKHFYIVNFQWCNGNTRDIMDASNTVIARLDKAPSYLIVCETGELAIEIYDYDPPHYVAMKKYMAANGIVSIKMRMLKETELLMIQDLPPDYELTSSSTDNKKMIGNAVPPGMVACLGQSYDDGEREFKMKAA